MGIGMRAQLPFRISSVVLLLFALGHTAGFLSFQPTEPEAVGVLDSMKRVPFDFGGHTVHWIDLQDSASPSPSPVLRRPSSPGD